MLHDASVGLDIAQFCPRNRMSGHMESRTGYLLALLECEPLPGPRVNEGMDGEAVAAPLLGSKGK